MKKLNFCLLIVLFCPVLRGHQGTDQNQNKFYVSPGAILERNYLEVIGEASELIKANVLQIKCQYRIESSNMDEAISKFSTTKKNLNKSIEKLEGKLNLNPIQNYKIQPNKIYNKKTRKHEQSGIILTSDFQLQFEKVSDHEIISRLFNDISGLTMMKSEFLFPYTDELRNKLRDLAIDDALTKIDQMAKKLDTPVSKAFQIVELEDFAPHYTSQVPHISYGTVNPWEKVISTRIRISVEIE